MERNSKTATETKGSEGDVRSYDQEAITPKEYRAFQDAYDFLNARLFDGSLPDVMVTLQRHAGTRGYFSPRRFFARDLRGTAHELALNPDTFVGRTDEEILSTLCHEMVHVWQETHGTAPTRCYHDREWARKMKDIGLQPTTTGRPGGKETGQAVTHMIIPGGAYARAYAELHASGLRLRWQSAGQIPAAPTAPGKNGIDPRATAKTKSAASKTKHSCPVCGQNAWAKPDASLICGVCHIAGSGIVIMKPAPTSQEIVH